MRNKSALLRLLTIVVAIGLLSLSGLRLAIGVDFERLQQALVSRFGADRAPLLLDWQRMLGDGRKASETEKLRRVNDFINQRITFDDDMSVWGKSDYWATPLELFGQGSGDCEDFAIAKYYSLLDLGIPINKLRLVYVKAAQTGPAGTFLQAHMVLAYYATPTAVPLILDNLNPQILPASRRSDLSPIFSFNSAGLWQGTGNNASTSSLSRWQDLLARARAEGFQ
ncbi:transglutaminase-like cysteine peptidase [Dechloromonas sp. HYN0024]|uniref:transglutaminase-like cysteine peptidase n=1 Tax=Dechloromonas sp. HYN0024 TaxID=2231055 RepID=UPI000E44549B|nr:transglutaminase-like cysteine peptidase [Dechloromonas sp. HYN0024]AXS80711.1 transglutaminase [Dechloromonas sp. HYN0024]